MRPTAAPFRPSELDPDLLLNVGQVATWLGISRRQVQRAGVPFVDFGKRSRRYRVRDVRAWLEQQRTVAAA